MELIEKYKISEEDTYKLSCIEKLKAESGLIQKEKLKAKSLGILKPYNVSFMDLGKLGSEIASLNSHSDAKLISKYGEYKPENTKSEYLPSGMKKFLTKPIYKKFLTWHLLLIILIGALGQENPNSSVNSDLTDRYSGEYKGFEKVAYGQVEYSLSVWEFTNNGDFAEAYVEGNAWDGSTVASFKGRMTVQLNDWTKVCLKDEYGSSMIGGDPCGVRYSQVEDGFPNGALIGPKGLVIGHTKLHKNWKHIATDVNGNMLDM